MSDEFFLSRPARFPDAKPGSRAVVQPLLHSLVGDARTPLLVLLVEEHANLWLTLPAAIIIGREIVVSALREWMAELGARAKVAVSRWGKWKTAAQMVALVILLGNPPAITVWVLIGYGLLMVAAGLTLWSMLQYLMAAGPHLSSTPKKK